MLDQRHHQRCFAGTASNDIADHNHGNPEAFGREKPAAVQSDAQPHGLAIDLSHWPEQAGQPSAYEPGFWQKLFHTFSAIAQGIDKQGMPGRP